MSEGKIPSLQSRLGLLAAALPQPPPVTAPSLGAAEGGTESLCNCSCVFRTGIISGKPAFLLECPSVLLGGERCLQRGPLDAFGREQETSVLRGGGGKVCVQRVSFQKPETEPAIRAFCPSRCLQSPWTKRVLSFTQVLR